MSDKSPDLFYVEVRTPSPRVSNYLSLLLGEFLGKGTAKDFDETIKELYETDRAEGTLRGEESFLKEQEAMNG